MTPDINTILTQIELHAAAPFVDGKAIGSLVIQLRKQLQQREMQRG